MNTYEKSMHKHLLLCNEVSHLFGGENVQANAVESGDDEAWGK